MRTFAVIATAALLAVLAVLANGWHQSRVETAVASCQRESGLRQVGALLWETMLAEEQTARLQCQQQWADARADNAALVLAQGERDAAHARDRDAWQQRWNSRPQSCDAALIEMERQCEPVLGRIE